MKNNTHADYYKVKPSPKAGYPIKNLADFIKSLPSLGTDAQDLSDVIKSIKKQASL